MTSEGFNFEPLDARMEDTPHTPLTFLAGRMLEVLDNEDPAGIILGMVLLDDENFAGIALRGYEDETEAIAYLMRHLGAMLAVRGQKLTVIPMDTPVGQG